MYISNNVIKISTVLIVSFFLLATSACQTNKQANAKIRKNTKILEKDPNNTEALYWRGNAYCDKREYEKAVIDYNMALKIDPYLTKVYLNRGSAFIELGEYDKALLDLNWVLEEKEQEAIFFMVYERRGYLYYKMGDYDKAIADFDKALEIEPAYFPATMGKAEAKKARANCPGLASWAISGQLSPTVWLNLILRP